MNPEFSFTNDHYRRSLALTLAQSYIEYGDQGPTSELLLENARAIDVYLRDKDENTSTAIGYATSGGRFADVPALIAAVEPFVTYLANG